MMQDTVLTMSRESVKEFVDFVLTFCPKSTKIINTNEVHNTFDKKMITEEDSDFEEFPHQDVDEKDLTENQKIDQWLFPMYDKNKDPNPLFILDLILKPNQLIPTYSTTPEEVVKKMLEVFDDGIDILKKIPQLEPILMKHLFKTHGQQHLKAPVRPMQKPAPPDPNKKSVLPDENTWLWEAYAALKEALTEAVKPLYDYV